ncbi:MAG: UDP-N-acetylmuramoyl-L-alanine--D-glutamate ligase [Simkaniaceae bacterium]|nr:UDP-N-acetylmuramoyl-L-alanine--D-glutamate ligase [Candidatus Sacchlamyda saccharinae]
MKALVIGLGISGQAARTFLEGKGYEVTCYDDKEPQEIADLGEFSLVVPSPGVRLDHPLCERARIAGVAMKGEAQLALEGLKQPCVAVTGTNGKTTVVRLIEHCLRYGGKKAIACGNVGRPLTSCVGGGEILVVELSSFQLESLEAKVLDMGVILNIEEDHLDWHQSMEAYAGAKARIQDCVTDEGELLLHESVPKNLFHRVFTTYRGDNVEAARLVCQRFGVEGNTFFQALSSFSKPEHRLEFVAEIEGVRYYNDSKATNVSAVVHALRTLQKKVVLLLGGQDKGLSFAPIAEMGEWIDQVIVFGKDREKIADALQSHQVHKVELLSQATQLAADLAKEAGTVLFSPGGASFDAFRNYEERGEEFKKLVRRRT